MYLAILYFIGFIIYGYAAAYFEPYDDSSTRVVFGLIWPVAIFLELMIYVQRHGVRAGKRRRERMRVKSQEQRQVDAQYQEAMRQVERELTSNRR